MEVEKKGRFIEMTHGGRTVKFDLQTGDKISWTGKRVKSLGAFYRDAGWRAATWRTRYSEGYHNPLDAFRDLPVNFSFIQWLKAHEKVRTVDGILTAWAKNFDTEKWFNVGIAPYTWQSGQPFSFPKKWLKLKYCYSTYQDFSRYSDEMLEAVYARHNGDKDKISYALYEAQRVRRVYDFSKRHFLFMLDIIETNWYEEKIRSKWRERHELCDIFTLMHQLDYRISKNKIMEHQKEVHDMLTRDFTLKKNEIADENFKRKITDQWDYENDKYLIRFPHSVTEIVEEGRKMGHCVASYADQVSDRMSILFLRLKADPDTPLVTIERRRDEVWQAKAARNRRPSDEILDFIDDFCKEKKLRRRGY